MASCSPYAVRGDKISQVQSFCLAPSRISTQQAERILDNLTSSTLTPYRLVDVEKKLRRFGGALIRFDDRPTHLPILPHDYKVHRIRPDVVVASAIVDSPDREETFLNLSYVDHRYRDIWNFVDTSVVGKVCV